MNILQISPQIPYPLSDGGKVGIFNITKHLAQRGHRITMVTFRRNRDQGDLSVLERYCTLVTVDHSTDNSIPKAIVNLFSTLPYNISKYQLPRLKTALSKVLAGSSFDVVHVDHLHMASYGLFCKETAGLPVVLREHNIESIIMERYATTTPGWLSRSYFASQLKRIRAFESRQSLQVDCCCVISEDDRRRLHALQPDATINVVSGGVDQSYFRSPSGEATLPYSICFFGSLDWIANRDAVAWFVQSILPIIVAQEPRTRCYIIGKGASKELERLQSEFVIFRGLVPDLPKEIERYAVTVAPIRIGSGIRLKILESFAMQIPVVSTTVGCEGIPARDGEHLLVADDAEGFANQVLRLFEDRSLANALSASAYALVDRQFRWERIAGELEQLYAEVIRRTMASRPQR